MQYLSGCKNTVIADDLQAGTMGLLNTPASRYNLNRVEVWAMDNGAFTGRYPGDDEFMALLGGLEAHRSRCLFVAAPDVVGDAQATLAQFPGMARRLRAAGWPVALVGQDGMESMEVPWDLVDWVFIGGSDQWKLGQGARDFIGQAQFQGKRVHVGRVNSAKRSAYFRSLGCDSADGTFIAFGPKINAPKVRQWIAADTQMQLL